MSITITTSTIKNQSIIICEIGTCTNTIMICAAYESCIVDCNEGCINTTINAKSSVQLTINNCNENCCTNLIIDLPIGIQNVDTNLANLNGNGVIKNSILYTQNGFIDFTMSSNLSMYKYTNILRDNAIKSIFLHCIIKWYFMLFIIRRQNMRYFRCYHYQCYNRYRIRIIRLCIIDSSSYKYIWNSNLLIIIRLYRINVRSVDST